MEGDDGWVGGGAGCGGAGGGWRVMMGGWGCGGAGCGRWKGWAGVDAAATAPHDDVSADAV